MNLKEQFENLQKITKECGQSKFDDDYSEPFLTLNKEPEYSSEYLLALKNSAAHLINQETKFKVGDIVEWKPKMRNKSTPYGKPMIITQVFNPPRISDSESGGAYFCEILDVACAETHPDGNILEYPYDSRRLQHFIEK